MYPDLPGARLTQEQCQVLAGKIPCANALDEAACFQAGCCYDGTDPTTPCYYGNTVTVQCLMDGHFILVVSRDMSAHPIILDSVRLAYAQAGCDPIWMTEAFVVFRFPLTQCGTTVQVIGDKLIYENQLISGIDIQTGPRGSITRDSTFILHARCIYNASDFLPVQVKVFLPPTPAPVIQTGPLRLELRIATDVSYGSYLTERDHPVVKVLRDPVYVEVRILQRTDPNLVLVLHQCWATPSANPLDQPQWPILVDGCPFLGDNYRTQLVPMGPASSELPFPTHHQRFVLSTFAFVDSAQMVLEGLVYIFCSASACSPSQLEPCRTICPSGVTASKSVLSVLSMGVACCWWWFQTHTGCSPGRVLNCPTSCSTA
uniref:Zona pellucida sperm-binding protein 1 n=1 Tax=Chelydra serpentina TaxID=8475 RepID=A0A8C3T501_CHESE